MLEGQRRGCSEQGSLQQAHSPLKGRELRPRQQDRVSMAPRGVIGSFATEFSEKGKTKA